MGVRKRGNFYHFQLEVNGKLYSGNTGYANKRQAADFARRLQADLIRADTLDRVFEARTRWLRQADGVPIDAAWSKFMAALDRVPSAGRVDIYHGQWTDFLAWLKDHHPGAATLADITPQMAQAYMREFRRKGAWTAKNRRQPSSSTSNEYLMICRRVIEANLAEAGMPKNPFAGIARAKANQLGKEPFTQAEMRIIRAKASGWIAHLFIVGSNTGLRLKDCAMLEWIEILLDEGLIRRRQSKTGSLVEIPIFPELREHLELLPRDGQHVSPEAAGLYARGQQKVSLPIQAFLREDCGIETSRRVEGRNRPQVVKGFHSLRHEFVLTARRAGIRLAVVQSIVGHLTPQMTRLYEAHVSDEELRDMAKKMTRARKG